MLFPAAYTPLMHAAYLACISIGRCIFAIAPLLKEFVSGSHELALLKCD